MNQEYTNRVWFISKYVNDKDETVPYDTFGARALWTSREPTREDHLRRRQEMTDTLTSDTLMTNN